MRLSIRNESSRPQLYYELIRKDGESVYEVVDHFRHFGGVYSLYTDDDREYTVEIKEVQ